MAEVVHFQLNLRAAMFVLNVGLAQRARTQGRAGQIDRRAFVFAILDGQKLTLGGNPLRGVCNPDDLRENRLLCIKSS